ncbi:hypothetical protein MBLNU230_g6842t1 [Neophaeotheca triangularis]
MEYNEYPPDCEICFDEDKLSTPADFYNHGPTEGCMHSVDACKLHINAWISSRVGTANIPCPSRHCDQLLTDSDIRKNASPETARRHFRLLERAKQERIPDWRWCLNPSCDAGQQHPNVNDIFTCNTCGARACAKCDRPYHDNETCEVFQSRTSSNRTDEDSQDLIDETTKPCPKCRVRIELGEGCDHIHCTRCEEHFCFYCGISASDTNGDGHAEDCPSKMSTGTLPVPIPARRD